MRTILNYSVCIFFFLAQLLSFHALSQGSNLASANNLLDKLGGSVKDGDGNVAGIEGSVFLKDEFSIGSLKTKEDSYSDLNMKYNILLDVFYFQKGKHVLVLDPRENIVRLELDGQLFFVRQFEYKSKLINGFLEVLVEGKYTLLAKKNISIRPAKEPKALESEGTPAAYVRKSDTYFLEMPDGTLEKVNNGKQITELVQNSELKSEAKRQKISLKKEADMPELVQLINEMEL